MRVVKARGAGRIAPSPTLAVLLQRLSGAPEGATFSAAERAAWPPADVALLSREGLLMEASAATWMQCPGCEQACAMPVEVVPRPNRPPAVFIACDKRDDMGMVPVALEDLAQWRSTRSAVASLLARLLGGPDAVPADDIGDGARVGVVQGAVGARPVFLVWRTSGPHLRVAGHELELALVLGAGAAGLALDMPQLARCVNSAVAPEPAEDPEHRRIRFKALLDEERRVKRSGCLVRAAARAGVNVEAFKKVAYRKRKPRTSAQHMVSAVTQAPRKR